MKIKKMKIKCPRYFNLYFNATSSVAPFFQRNLNLQVIRINKKSSFSFKISIKDTSFYIYLNSLRFYLSPECLLSFLSNLCMTPCIGENFKFMMFASLENVLNLGIFTHATLLPTQNSPQVVIITP